MELFFILGGYFILASATYINAVLEARKEERANRRRHA